MTRYRYDPDGWLVSIQDAREREWVLERDPLGRLVAERTFEGRHLLYERDAAGHLVASRDAGGHRTEYGRDASGRLRSRVFHDGTKETFNYDQRGLLIKAEGPTVAVSLEYDAIGHVIAESFDGQTVRSRYDALGSRISRESPYGRSLLMEHNPEGRLESIRDAEGLCVRFVYNLLEQEVRRTLIGEVDSEHRYSPTGELLSCCVKWRDQTLLVREYHHGPDGQLEEVRDTKLGVTKFFYDPNGRLASAEYPGGAVEHYLYDPAGNVPGIPEGQVSSKPSRFQGDIEGWQLRFENGRIVEKLNRDTSFLYEYDAADRLIRVTRDGREVATYAYDPLGRRIRKQVGGAATEFLWDGQTLLGERVHRPDKPPGSPTEYLFEPDGWKPIAIFGGDGACLLETDQVGMPWATIDREGDVIWLARFKSFGALGEEIGADRGVPLRFPGQYADAETGLFYNRFRYYDPELRMYTSPDPVGLLGGTEPYNYVTDPSRWIDPYGLGRVCGGCADCATKDATLVRRGSSYESATRLQKQAAAAEAHGFPHGVSVTTPESNLRLSRNPSDASQATREAFEDVGFPVHHTPTANDPLHHTVELPSEVTPEVADRFNSVLGRSK